VWDLLLCAKHLFVAAIVATAGAGGLRMGNGTAEIMRQTGKSKSMVWGWHPPTAERRDLGRDGGGKGQTRGLSQRQS
jgi:hypothetical protein